MDFIAAKAFFKEKKIILNDFVKEYCREFTSAHSQQPDSSRKSLVSERKLLTTKLSSLICFT